jgi:hypothetical protein
MAIAIPPEFDEQGIKPLVHGIPALPKAAQTNALARQLQRDGLVAADGTRVADFSAAHSRLLAYPWAIPEQIRAQLRAPQAITTQAGVLYEVTGLVLLTRVMPPYHNSRVRPRLAIPAPDARGQVLTPWPTVDVSDDPENPHRLRVEAEDLTFLAASARATADHVVSMQSKLSELLAREGVEKHILLAPARFELVNGQLDDDLVWLASDGGSRVTIEHGYLADVIDTMLEGEGLSAKRRAGLKELGIHLRGRTAGLLGRDGVAERDLQNELVRLLDEPAADLIASGLFAGQRALVAPARAIVGFVPHGGTLLDAVQQLIANEHKRGPLPWDAAARSIDTRDEMLRKLAEAGKITDAEVCLFGPRFEEAHSVYGLSENPDYRIGQLTRLIHDGHPASRDARKAIRDILRVGRLSRQMCAQVLGAAIMEQHRTMNAAARDNIEATLNEILAYPPFTGIEVGVRDNDSDVDELLEEARTEHAALPTAWTPAKVELAAKGGVALALLGALQRQFKTDDKEQRAYNVLQRMANDPFGHELFATALRALRGGEAYLPKLDPETRKPVGNTAGGDPIQMRGDNLRELFPTSAQTVANAQPTAGEVIKQLERTLSVGAGSLLDELEELDDVKDRGVDPTTGTAEVIELLEDYRDRIKYLQRRHRDYYGSAAGDKHGGLVPDEAVEVLAGPDEDALASDVA